MKYWKLILLGLLMIILFFVCDSILPKRTYKQEAIYESYYSKNNKNHIYSSVNKGEAPQVFTVINGKKERITDSESIKFNPVINNAGDSAYVVHEYASDESYIIVNGKF